MEKYSGRHTEAQSSHQEPRLHPMLERTPRDRDTYGDLGETVTLKVYCQSGITLEQEEDELTDPNLG